MSLLCGLIRRYMLIICAINNPKRYYDVSKIYNNNVIAQRARLAGGRTTIIQPGRVVMSPYTPIPDCVMPF